jgi:hypothetical protein
MLEAFEIKQAPRKRGVFVYQTPGGDRVLLDAERRFFTQSLGMVVDLLSEGDMDFGVMPFDELQRNQKLVVLYKSARGLLHPKEPVPQLTAYIESAVAVVYEHAKHQVYQEIDDPEYSPGRSFWRSLVLDAAREQVGFDEMPDDTDCDKETWLMLLECLAGCVLWDNDYESEATLDVPPEKARNLRAALGMPDDYYTDVPPDPPDDTANLYVDALMGLTADAR